MKIIKAIFRGPLLIIMAISIASYAMLLDIMGVYSIDNKLEDKFIEYYDKLA